LLLALLCSCHRRHDVPLHPALQRADSLMRQHPDSALALLSRFNSRSFKDSSDKAAYALLRTKADDKNYIDHTNDSLIRLAVRYYDRHGDDLQKAEAHYYLGRIYQNARNDVHTAEQFLAADYYAEYAKDTNLICNIKSNLGFLLWNNGILSEADSIYKLIIPYEKSQKDFEGLAITYKLLGDISMQKEKTNYSYAWKYLNKSIYYCQLIKTNVIKANCLISMANLAFYETNYIKCINCSRKALHYIDDNSKYQGIELLIGSAYREMNKYDSAAFYLKRASCSNYSSTRATSYKLLSEVSHTLGDYKDAWRYNKLYEHYSNVSNDSYKALDVITAIKNTLLQSNKNIYRNNLLYYLLTCGILLILIIAIILYFYKKRGKEKKSIQNLMNEISKDNMKIEESRYKITSLEQKIMLFKQDMESRDKERSTLNKKVIDLFKEKEILSYELNDIAGQKDKLQQILDKISTHRIIIELPSYKVIQEMIKKGETAEFKDKIFKELLNDMKLYIPEFISRIARYEDLLEEDIIFCCLVKLKFTYKEIAALLSYSNDNAYKKEKAILKRMKYTGRSKLKELLNNL
jgi:hypothetical protein